MINEETPKPKGRPSLTKTIVKIGQVAGGLSAVGGFCGDFLKPLASINLIAFALASALTVVLLVLCIRKVTVFGYGLGLACGSCLILAIGFGSWWGLAEFEGGKDRGFLAGKFSLVGRLQDAVLDERKVAGGPLARDADRAQDDEAREGQRLAAALEGYPLNVLEARTVGEPRRLASSGDEVTVGYDLTLGVDATAYDAFAKKLVAVLDAEGGKKGEAFTVNTPINLADERDPHSSLTRQNLIYDVFGVAEYDARFKLMQAMTYRNPVVLGDGFSELVIRPRGRSADPAGEADRPGTILIVNTSRNQLGDRTTWCRYDLKSRPALPSGLRIGVAFLDARGQEITRDSVELKSTFPGLLPSGPNRPATIVSPYTISDGRSLGGMTLPRSLKMTKAELKAMSKVRCKAETIPAPRP